MGEIFHHRLYLSPVILSNCAQLSKRKQRANAADFYLTSTYSQLQVGGGAENQFSQLTFVCILFLEVTGSWHLMHFFPRKLRNRFCVAKSLEYAIRSFRSQRSIKHALLRVIVSGTARKVSPFPRLCHLHGNIRLAFIFFVLRVKMKAPLGFYAQAGGHSMHWGRN